MSVKKKLEQNYFQNSRLNSGHSHKTLQIMKPSQTQEKFHTLIIENDNPDDYVLNKDNSQINISVSPNERKKTKK